MNRLSSQQRKMMYLAGIVVLLIPVIWLGMPASATEGSGGRLAELRRSYDLGESTLGEVDPSSAAMNLVLLGLRGVAANLLWMEHEELKKTKNWSQMRATTKSIILLQPHFMEVWSYHGWNLAYNVSSDWDAVPDRYYWVKEGAKFTMEGTRRNRKFPELYWDVGRILGQKVGRADEWRFFRKYFNKDPDEKRFPDGPDPEMNPKGQDNYLAAREWYHLANDVEGPPPLRYQKKMMRMLFRHYPARSSLDYADAMQREGLFGELTQNAWSRAFQDWTTRYENGDVGFGKEEFVSPGGTIILEAYDEDVERLAKRDNVKIEVKKDWIGNYQNLVNYLYWRTRADSEDDSNTLEAHRELYQGRQLYRKHDFSPVTYQAQPETCEKLAELKLPAIQQVVLRSICQSGDSMTYGQLIDDEDIKSIFTKLNQAALLSTLNALVDKKLVDKNVSLAQARLESGMKKFAKLLTDYPTLSTEDLTIEEGLTAYLYWRAIHLLSGDPLPQDFPLRALVEKEGSRLPELEREFKRETASR